MSGVFTSTSLPLARNAPVAGTTEMILWEQ